MKLDKDDQAILMVLREDGRASLREIARRASIFTPTVSSHLSRMIKGEIIKFAPVFSMYTGVAAIVIMEVPVAELASVSKKWQRWRTCHQC